MAQLEKEAEQMESKKALEVLKALQRRGWTAQQILDFAFEVLEGSENNKSASAVTEAQKPRN